MPEIRSPSVDIKLAGCVRSGGEERMGALSKGGSLVGPTEIPQGDQFEAASREIPARRLFRENPFPRPLRSIHQDFSGNPGMSHITRIRTKVFQHQFFFRQGDNLVRFIAAESAAHAQRVSMQ